MESMFYAPFSCKGDNACLGVKWNKWKRGFEIFLSAKGITEDIRKKNLLLQSVGPEVQDIFFTLPESEDTENEQQYNLTMQALDGYFGPKSHAVYERYLFRSLKQHRGESISEFVTKLMEQGKKCNYADLNDQIRDQVIEKCLSYELRWNILEKGEIKLEELLEIAKAFEDMHLHVNDIEELAAGMPTEARTHREHDCPSPTHPESDTHACCKGARPEGQRDEQESTFSVSEEMDSERVHSNRMHNPTVEKSTGFW